MKRSARDAGRRLAGRVGAALLALAGAALVAGCAAIGEGTATQGPGFGSLAPQGMFLGGFASAPAAAPGQVGAQPGGAFVKLHYPSSVAANGPFLWVADTGAGALLRVDTITQAVTRVAAIPPVPGARVRTGPDGSVYVLRPDRGEVLRFAFDGQPLPALVAPIDILTPADLVVEPVLNRVWVADAAGALFAFHSTGRMSERLSGRGDGFPAPGTGAVLLAAGERAVVGIEPRCRCVLGFDADGRERTRFGEGELVNPAGLALDHHGRTWVIDRGDGQLKVFRDGILVERLAAARLGLGELTAIAIDRQRVYLADGPGGRIGLFALLPPRTP